MKMLWARDDVGIPIPGRGIYLYPAGVYTDTR
jgi:hypothetical protein